MPENVSSSVFADLAVGASAEFEVQITDALVRSFAELSGDFSPLHVDEAFAAQTPFGGRIAHGMIGGALFSRLVGIHLPGRNAVYLSQELRFRQPMRIGMRVIVRGSVTQTSEATRTVTIRTELIDASTKELLTDGQALVRLMQ